MFKFAFLVLAAISFLIATPPANSAKHQDEVRVSYGGKENTPDYLMFDFLLRAMVLRQEANEEFALGIVREQMQLESRELAQAFLARLLSVGDDVSQSKNALDVAVLCQDNTAQTEASLYEALDSSDDLKRNIARSAYSDFIITLDDRDRQNFDAWLDEAKQGYSYTAFKHERLFEDRGIDVKVHLQQICITKEQKRAGRLEP